MTAYQNIKDTFGGRLGVVNKNGRLYFATIPTNEELKEITEEYNRNKTMFKQDGKGIGNRLHLPKIGGRE